MKKFWTVVFVIACVACALMGALTGMSALAEETSPEPERFDIVDTNDPMSNYMSYSIIVDSDTGVEYLCIRHKNGSPSVTPLLDADGKPVIYAGEG